MNEYSICAENVSHVKKGHKNFVIHIVVAKLPNYYYCGIEPCSEIVRFWVQIASQTKKTLNKKLRIPLSLQQDC
jgi:hypothetical protein